MSDSNDIVIAAGDRLTVTSYDQETGAYRSLLDMDDQGNPAFAGNISVRAQDITATHNDDVMAGASGHVILDTAIPPMSLIPGIDVTVLDADAPETLQVSTTVSTIGGVVTAHSGGTGGGSTFTIVAAVCADAGSPIATYWTSAAHGFSVSDTVTVSGMIPSAFNGTGSVLPAPSTYSFRMTKGGVITSPTTYGFVTAGGSGGGSASSFTFDDLGSHAQAIKAGETYLFGASATFNATNHFRAGQLVHITSATPSTYNGYWTIVAANAISFAIATDTNLGNPSAGTATVGSMTATITGGVGAAVETVTVDPSWNGSNPVVLSTSTTDTHTGDGFSDAQGRITAFTPTHGFAYDHSGPVSFTWQNPVNWNIGTSYTSPRYVGDSVSGYGLSLGDYLTVHPDGSLSLKGNLVFDDAGVHTVAPDAKAPLVITVAASGSTLALPDPAVYAMTDVTLTADCAITLTDPVAGQSFDLIIRQDGTGSHIVTYVGLIKWPGGTVPTLSTAPNAVDSFRIWSPDGATWLARTQGLAFA